MMRKLIAMMLAAMTLVCLCTAAWAEADSDLAYVQGKGKLLVGITEFEPMDYRDADGSWIGFDADVAKMFAASIGVEAEFVEIDWDNKSLDLDSKKIDCVWNGMTIREDVLALMDCSEPYCNNAQVVILPSARAADYPDKDSLASLSFAVEAGSAGADEIAKLGFSATEVARQADALMEVAAGTSDAAVIDALMAAAMVGEGTGYPDLVWTIPLNEEQYGVGFRKGSDLVALLNTFFKDNAGQIAQEAQQYGIQAALITP